jgi:hypothetical protein
MGEKECIDRDKKGIEAIKINDGGTRDRLFTITQVKGAAVGLLFIAFGIHNRKTVGSTDDRTGGIEQTAVIFKQRAAFSPGVFSHMGKDRGPTCLRKGFEGGMQGFRLHRKEGDCRTAAAAPLTAGNLTGENILDPPAEGIHTGYHLTIVVEQIIHEQQVTQNRGKSKRQFVA